MQRVTWFSVFWRSLLLGALLLGGSVRAQEISPPPVTLSPNIDPTALSDQELLDLIDWLERNRLDEARPVSIIGIPSGFGLPRGVGFAAAGFTNRRDRGQLGDLDGSVVFGLGFGDATRFVSVMPIVDITSVTPSKFGSSGKIGLQVSRNLQLRRGWQGAVALDFANLVTWGDSNVLDEDIGIAFSAVRPAGPGQARPVMFSLGYGTGVASRGTTEGVFAGIGVGLSPNYGVSLAWYGDEAIGGVAIWPTPGKNVQLSVGVGDITNEVNGRRLLLSLSVSRLFEGIR